MIAASSFLDFLLVGFLWGATTPFLGQTSSSKTKKTKDVNFLAHLKSLFTKLPFLVAFLLNQCGSIFYYRLLAIYPLPVASSAANALSFCFSGVVDALLKKSLPSWKVILGSAMVVIGIGLVN
jgi:drug/metabolite transporter (DMT)-like permease